MKFKIKKGTNIVITFLACVACIFLLKSNFGLTNDEIIGYTGILFLLLIVLLTAAGILVFLIRALQAKNEKHFFDDDNDI